MVEVLFGVICSGSQRTCIIVLKQHLTIINILCFRWKKFALIFSLLTVRAVRKGHAFCLSLAPGVLQTDECYSVG